MTQPSEFSGYSGTIQPEPHTLSAPEQARLERRVRSWDEEDDVEAARFREVNGIDDETSEAP